MMAIFADIWGQGQKTLDITALQTQMIASRRASLQRRDAV